MREACLVINRDALRHNLKRVRELAPHSAVLAMVKADAYGHGVKMVAETLSDTDAFGVAFLEEALALRDAGITQPVALLEGVFSAAEMAEAVKKSCMVIVHQPEQIVWLEQCQAVGKITVWIKIDTGMHRLGFKPEHVQAAHDRVRAARVTGDVGLMTHFATADMPDRTQTEHQIACFQSVYQSLNCNKENRLLVSLCNSAGILEWPDVQGDWVRPGIMLYGSSPFAAKTAKELGLQPVMTLSSRLIAINEVAQGEPVGYGATWRAERNTRIGVVAIGYGDGYPRHAQSGTPVLVDGHRVPLVGRVSMDMITVDLGTLPVQVGAPCVLWGEGLPVEEVATAANTLSYELFCKVTARVHRSKT